MAQTTKEASYIIVLGIVISVLPISLIKVREYVLIMFSTVQGLRPDWTTRSSLFAPECSTNSHGKISTRQAINRKPVVVVECLLYSKKRRVAACARDVTTRAQCHCGYTEFSLEPDDRLPLSRRIRPVVFTDAHRSNYLACTMKCIRPLAA